MVDNPFSYSEYLPTLLRVAMVLLVLLVGAVWRSYRQKKQGGHSSMLAKILTVLWVAPILITSLFSGELVLVLIVAVLLAQGIREYARLVNLWLPYSVVLLAVSFAALGLSSIDVAVALIAAPYIGFTLATLVPIVSGRTTDAHRQVGSVIFGVIYIGVPLSLIVYIRQFVRGGIEFLVVIGCAIAFTDAGAFIFGSWLKGPRLVPKVSPAKTWSGAGGALVGSGIGLALLWGVSPASWTLATIAVLWPVVAVSAIVGDLVESFVKRDFDIKDAGTVLAGFGGVLDRFDSLFLAIPISYLVLRLV
jgi:phosphatidate cytidylyltransferase